MITNWNLAQSNIANLFTKMSSLDWSKHWVVNVTEKNQKRTNAQNNWARGFARDCSSYFGYSPDEMYDLLMYIHNPAFKINPETNETIRLPGSFSKLNTKEAAKVQEAIEIWAVGMGYVWE